MRAAAFSEYGPPDVVRVMDLPTPSPAAGEILVRVHNSSVNPLDWHVVRGQPFPLRFQLGGLRRPRSPRPAGYDFAGTVAAVGPGVTEFAPGDAVFGGEFKALADYVAVKAEGVARKPAAVTFEQAGCAWVAGITALIAVQSQAQVQAGQTVLINGASGGVGTFAVQIAKALGAHVTGVQSTRNLELVRSLGADEVIDYTRDDFTASGRRYDVLIDTVGNRPLPELRRVLQPRAVIVGMGGGTAKDGFPWGRMLESLAMGPFISQRSRSVLRKPTRAEMQALANLLEAGTVRAVIDRRYTLAETADALRYLESARVRGKLAVRVADGD